MSYSAKDFPAGSKAIATKTGREVEVIKAQPKGSLVIVRVKGLDETDPEKEMSIAAEANGEKFLEPLTEVSGDGVVEDDFFEEDETPRETPTEKEETPEEAPEEDKERELLAAWLHAGMTEDQFYKVKEKEGIEFIDKLVGTLSEALKAAKKAKAKTREIDWSKAKLNKYWQAGEYVPIADWLKEGGFSNKKEDVESFIEASRAIPNACQYTGEGIKVKTQMINTSVLVGYTELYRRLVEFYPTAVKLGIVKDNFKLEVK